MKRRIWCLSALTCLLVAGWAWATVSHASSSVDMGGHYFFYYGHAAWQTYQIGGEGNIHFETLKHANGDCGEEYCDNSQEGWQKCNRTGAVNNYTHKTEIKLREDDTERVNDFFTHTHDPNNSFEKRSPLVWTDQWDPAAWPEYKFQVYIYWNDGTYRAHVTTVMF